MLYHNLSGKVSSNIMMSKISHYDAMMCINPYL